MPRYPFSPQILDALPEELTELFRGLELKLLEEICSRLRIADQLNEVTVQDIRALRAHGVPLKRVKRDLFIKRLQTICFTAILACAIVTIIFGILTSPEFFPYSDNLLNVIDVPDGGVIITLVHEVYDV